MDSGCKYFVQLCRDLFQLEANHGFTASKPRRGRLECIWRLTKGDFEVLFMVEHVETYGVPTIQFRPPNRNQTVGLHELVPTLDPDHDAKRPKDVSYTMSRAQLRGLLEHWAEFFHAHAEQVLDGHQKTFAAVKKFRATEPDPYP